MKKRISIFGVIAAAMFLSISAEAHLGKGGIGLRATPDGGGFTGKAYIGKHLAFEGMLNVGGIFGRKGESFTAVALLEAHIPLPDESWRLIFGGGLHGGAWNNGRWYHEKDNVWITDRAEPLFGMDAIAGVEYVFKKIPLSLSADIKPAVNFTNRGPEFFDHNMFGMAVRYHFR